MPSCGTLVVLPNLMVCGMVAQADQTVLQKLEACAPRAIGSGWEEKLSWDLRTNLGRYRKYRSSTLRDLLRVIRNKHNHFREMPAHLQEEMALPVGFLQYACYQGVPIHVRLAVSASLLLLVLKGCREPA